MDNFKEDNFHSLCNKLATKDQVFASILSRHGYPPFWSREPGFPTLIQIILEQQVSLASARAAFPEIAGFAGFNRSGCSARAF
jgi:DNA-3-methyladenine glycosylase II